MDVSIVCVMTDENYWFSALGTWVKIANFICFKVTTLVPTNCITLNSWLALRSGWAWRTGGTGGPGFPVL